MWDRMNAKAEGDAEREKRVKISYRERQLAELIKPFAPYLRSLEDFGAAGYSTMVTSEGFCYVTVYVKKWSDELMKRFKDLDFAISDAADKAHLDRFRVQTRDVT